MEPRCRPGAFLPRLRNNVSSIATTQWHTIIRKAVRKEALSAVMDLGTPGEQVAYRLIHAHCRRRLDASKPSTLP